MQHLCSRTLKPSHTESFVESWTSFPEDSRVSHSQLLESVKLLKTPDTSSPTSQTESESANLELFSSKTWQESSLLRLETEIPFSNMSSKNWKDWVTEQRQEYSQRKKLAHLIRESESLSWATPNVCGNHNRKGASKTSGDGLSTQVKNWATPNTMDYMEQRSPEALQRQFETTRKGRTAPANLREQIHPQNWPTATTRDWKDTNATVPPSRANPSKQTLGQRVAHVGLQDQANPNTNGKSQESWLTPRVLEVDEDYENYQKRMQESGNPKNVGKKNPANLTMQAKSQESWPTPRANKVHPEITEKNREHLANRKKANLEEDIAGHCGKATGKLNPNWVEHLMGLPAGWTDLGSWETE